MIITFIGFKITFRNIGSHNAPLFISRGWHLATPVDFVAFSNVRFDRVNQTKNPVQLGKTITYLEHTFVAHAGNKHIVGRLGNS